MDNNKITIFFHKHDDMECDNFRKNVLSKLLIPSQNNIPFAVNAVRLKDGGRGALYNKAMYLSDAKYKIYIAESVVDLDPYIIFWIMQEFFKEKRAGMIGFLGSGMPISGKPCDVHKRWGKYVQRGQELKDYEAPIINQEVNLIDSQVLATCEDVPWAEDCDEFLGAIACLERRRRGIGVVVPMVPKAAFVSSLPSEYDRLVSDDAAYKRYFEHYKAELQPLVSVLIPAYNEPEFCEEAIKSVLEQDYGNIELLIGDDSTDDRVEKMIQPYLEKYDYIHYDHHDKSYGANANTRDLLVRCHGEYVNILLHDDIFYPRKISVMASFLTEDINEEVGFVTSVRPYFQEKIIIPDPFALVFEQEYLLCGEELARKMLLSCVNVVGEMSTVLLRKSLLKVKDDTKHPYHLGRFCGYEEHSMGDISTWLNILSRKKCVFLRKPYSAFRRSENQNTWKPKIIIQASLDWLNMIVAAWLHGEILHSRKDFEHACQGWKERLKFHVISNASKFTGELQESYQTFLEEVEALEKDDYETCIRLAVENMTKGKISDNG